MPERTLRELDPDNRYFGRVRLEIYIGADNKTHKIGSKYFEIIKGWADKFFSGYTILRASGVWNGSIEESLLIIALVDNTRFTPTLFYSGDKAFFLSALYRSLGGLKRELRQNSILLTQSEVKGSVLV